MNKYKSCLIIVFLFLFQVHIYGETTKTGQSSFPNIFHNFGGNLAGSVAYNYGLNFIGAALGTWIIIETGIDWKWRNTVYDNRWLESIGSVAMPLGNVVPIVTPVLFYLSGKYYGNEKTITAAEALTQTLILTMAIQTPIKMVTGRREPGLVDRAGLFDDDLHVRVSGEDDFSDEWKLFDMDFIAGWPSGHTANAFAAAATLAEIYHDNIWVKIGVYTYATFIGFGTTTGSHWLSEAFAGSLIGYAIGKTVGKSYRELLEGNEEKKHAAIYPYFSGSSMGIFMHIPI